MPLPKGLQFLQAGWWLSHAIVILLLYSWAYRRGRADEKRAHHAAERESEKP